jgi:uncharacterized protein
MWNFKASSRSSPQDGRGPLLHEGGATDRVGLSWRPELAAGILRNLDQIDIVEVIADDYFDASDGEVRSLRTLATQCPVMLHGVSMGLASAARPDAKRLERMARLLDRVRPESWSEHLAFVRAGGIEIEHLAAPPRTEASVAATAENLERARKVTGEMPQVENVATLIDPPGSRLSEIEWLVRILGSTTADLLLDLHNVHANSVNFGWDPFALLDRLPMERVRSIHIAGGKWIRPGRVLDDHLHDVPDPVYDLLAGVAARCPQPLTVVLERDGAYPEMSELLAQLERARRAVRQGRALGCTV